MKQLTLSIILLLTTFTLAAQNYDCTVSESSYKFTDGSHNALKVNLYELTLEEAEKLTKKWLKDYKGKVKFENHEFTALGSKDKDMGKLDFNMRATLIPNGEALSLIVSIDLGGGYLNSSDHKEQFKVFKKKLKKFATESSVEGIKYQLKAAQELLKKNEKIQKELADDKKDMEKKIEEAKEIIKKKEEEIKENIEKQGSQKKVIEANKEALKVVETKLTKIQ